MTKPLENHGNNGLLEVVEVQTDEDFQQCAKIRREVFVIGQQIPAEEEFDSFEKTATHFLARCDGEACGAARWRNTEKGIKLERFAVLASYRGRGVGSVLVAAVLESIKNPSTPRAKEIYLHAQETAVKFYKRLNFVEVGAPFYECNIKHFKMVYRAIAT